jgi:hypothetical protein
MFLLVKHVEHVDDTRQLFLARGGMREEMLTGGVTIIEHGESIELWMIGRTTA